MKVKNTKKAVKKWCAIYNAPHCQDSFLAFLS